jgi:hypothetical protein
MQPTESPEGSEAAPGYLSENHKRRFTTTAGILGAVFFFGQFIQPFVNRSDPGD